MVSLLSHLDCVSLSVIELTGGGSATKQATIFLFLKEKCYIYVMRLYALIKLWQTWKFFFLGTLKFWKYRFGGKKSVNYHKFEFATKKA